MNNDSNFAHGKIGERALVAAFGDRDSAHLAAKELHDEGFHKIWIGLTRPDATVRSEDDSLPAKLGRYISGEGDGLTLVDTLRQHGVSDMEALRVEQQVQANDVLLTVNSSNHPELAANIIEDAGGEILSGESFVFTTVDWAATDSLRNERMLNPTVPTLREDIFIARFDDEATISKENSFS